MKDHQYIIRTSHSLFAMQDGKTGDIIITVGNASGFGKVDMPKDSPLFALLSESLAEPNREECFDLFVAGALEGINERGLGRKVFDI